MGWLRTIVEDPRTERVIMALIIINAVILGLETSKTVMAQYRPAARDPRPRHPGGVRDRDRGAHHRAALAFFRDPWSIFDFIVIGIALVPATETFTVLRALRVLRLLRLITAVPSLRRVVAGLIARCPAWARSCC